MSVEVEREDNESNCYCLSCSAKIDEYGNGNFSTIKIGVGDTCKLSITLCWDCMTDLKEQII